MAFCSSCGAKLEDGARFCSNCGTQTQQSNYKYKRTEEYAGKIIKCPACGAELPSFTAVCPGCGHEINSSKVSDSLKSFIAQIDDCDRRITNSPEVSKKGWSTWGTGKKIGWVILNYFLVCIPLMIYLIIPLFRIDNVPALTNEEKHKATIIENFPFPNDRGSILDALMFIKSKVSFLVTKKANVNNAYWTGLWMKKAEDLYQKAELMFPGDQIASGAYKDIVNNSAKVKKKLKIRLLIKVAITVAVIIFIGNLVANNK
ncbi:zinc ribbon domain-containing protein [Bacillus sp. FJAT-27445]|uniref:zinc ribbon domain-containing protein n=1 Tax=Bacillus sp. FJAT-27445 TaxID=1679166 RepID=UPI0007441AD8|nr:zinc ribbon domain-containing protein [Bacillus sp. FJAT-27445]